MTGRMQWRQSSTTDRAKILWVQSPGKAWVPYTASPLMVPDYSPIQGVSHSRGWATCQRLLKAGYELIASDPAENAAEDREYQQSTEQVAPVVANLQA